MKKLTRIIFIWFVVQLVLISALGNMDTASSYGRAVERGVDPTSAYLLEKNVDCEDSNGAIGFIAGLLFPITETPLVSGDWCWNFATN